MLTFCFWIQKKKKAVKISQQHMTTTTRRTDHVQNQRCSTTRSAPTSISFRSPFRIDHDAKKRWRRATEPRRCVLPCLLTEEGRCCSASTVQKGHHATTYCHFLRDVTRFPPRKGRELNTVLGTDSSLWSFFFLIGGLARVDVGRTVSNKARRYI